MQDDTTNQGGMGGYNPSTPSNDTGMGDQSDQHPTADDQAPVTGGDVPASSPSDMPSAPVDGGQPAPTEDGGMGGDKPAEPAPMGEGLPADDNAGNGQPAA